MNFGPFSLIPQNLEPKQINEWNPESPRSQRMIKGLLGSISSQWLGSQVYIQWAEFKLSNFNFIKKIGQSHSLSWMCVHIQYIWGLGWLWIPQHREALAIFWRIEPTSILVTMASMKLQKRLAACLLHCGQGKVWLDPNEISNISLANSSMLFFFPFFLYLLYIFIYIYITLCVKAHIE